MTGGHYWRHTWRKWGKIKTWCWVPSHYTKGQMRHFNLKLITWMTSWAQEVKKKTKRKKAGISLSVHWFWICRWITSCSTQLWLFESAINHRGTALLKVSVSSKKFQYCDNQKRLKKKYMETRNSSNRWQQWNVPLSHNDIIKVGCVWRFCRQIYSSYLFSAGQSPQHWYGHLKKHSCSAPVTSAPTFSAILIIFGSVRLHSGSKRAPS